jgi:hypothetical protein
MVQSFRSMDRFDPWGLYFDFLTTNISFWENDSSFKSYVLKHAEKNNVHFYGVKIVVFGTLQHTTFLWKRNTKSHWPKNFKLRMFLWLRTSICSITRAAWGQTTQFFSIITSRRPYPTFYPMYTRNLSQGKWQEVGSKSCSGKLQNACNFTCMSPIHLHGKMLTLKGNFTFLLPSSYFIPWVKLSKN